MRQIVLDTETSGLLLEQGHRIIEIGAVELHAGIPTGRTLHQYLDPQRDIEPGAIAVHGITSQELIGQPRFADIAEEFTWFIHGADLIIHNAPFDVGFMNAELERLGPGWARIEDYVTAITCTRALARERLPGIRHSLDNLCDYYGIDRSQRHYHGALVDAELLARVYMQLKEEERHASA